MRAAVEETGLRSPVARENGGRHLRLTGAGCGLVCLLLATFPAGAGDAASQLREPAHAVSGSINVRDFGAAGDGITDDTDAIQRALLAAAGEDTRPRFVFWAWTAAPEVFFPAGTYRISRTLLVPACGGGDRGVSNHINLRGDDSEIRQTDAARDILYLRKAHQILIEGLTFTGGRRQLKIWSKNTDRARITIRNCRFRDSAGVAIDDQLRLDPAVKPADWFTNVLEPFRIAARADGLPDLLPVDESSYPVCLFVSSAMRISGCSFLRCRQVLSVWADFAVMDACTIETHPDMEGPAILCGTALRIEDVDGLAHVTPGRRQWWITLHPGKQLSGVASLDLRRLRLATDADTGWCVVRNEAKWTGGVHVCILAEDCAFQSAGSREDCVFHLVQAPNLIAIRGCRELTGKAVDILGFEQPFDASHFKPAVSWKILDYALDGNDRSLRANLPEPMRPLASVPLPRQASTWFRFPESPVEMPVPQGDVTASINVADHGATGARDADAGPAFDAALAEAAARRGLAEIVVPAGVYRFRRPVVLPPRVALRGVGQVFLTAAPEHGGAIFTVADARRLVLQNLHFFHCGQALACATRPRRRATVLVDHCQFTSISNRAITCLSGGGKAGERNRTALRINDSTFVRTRPLLHNADHALMENAWVTTDPDAPEGAVIENRGRLHLRDLLGVPRPNTNDVRWIDNHGDMLIDRCRFGGEARGLPIIVNWSEQGAVLIQNSWLFCRGNPRRVTIVDCEQIPARLALRGNWGWPPPNGPQMMVTIRQGAQGTLEGRFYESCNTVWRRIHDERDGTTSEP